MPEELGKKYIRIFQREIPFEFDVFSEMCTYLFSQWEYILNDAKKNNEYERFMDIEIKVSSILQLSTVSGVSINTKLLRTHKKSIEHEYYLALKNFSAKYNLPLEVPRDDEILEFLMSLGFDFSGISIDYILDFFPNSEYAIDLTNLKKLSDAKYILMSMVGSKDRVFPIVDIFGSITSRIYNKDPVFQNLAKRYRNVVQPDAGYIFSYIDYDQFEVGIMAALSGDPELLLLYSESDAYEKIADILFKDKNKRKYAKRIFLSFAYGMKLHKVFDAAVNYGADREASKAFFRSFKAFEEWKKCVCNAYYSSGYIGTEVGNYIFRKSSDELSEKEKRSAVSQVVQGTGSLIFKKTIIAVDSDPNLTVKIPMHDAILIQHPPEYDANNIVSIFCSVMTAHFDRKIKGKASVAEFCSP